MDNNLYTTKIICPVCSTELTVTKVKVKSCKVISRDTDFCVYYEGVNPMFYEPVVCELCGYASLTDKFEDISSKDILNVRKDITSRWLKHTFSGERNIDKAIDAFKITLYNYQVRSMKQNDIAKVCIRIAWLYRFKKDEKEKQFLQYTLDAYLKTYNKEKFPVDKLDEVTCMYMIAEMNRRLENIDEARKWFNKLICSPEAKKNTSLLNEARELFMLIKDIK